MKKCTRCNGVGELADPWRNCPECHGMGEVPVRANAEVFLAATAALFDGEAQAAVGDFRDEGTRVIEFFPKEEPKL